MSWTKLEMICVHMTKFKMSNFGNVLLDKLNYGKVHTLALIGFVFILVLIVLNLKCAIWCMYCCVIVFYP
jgi:hypothetical protein